MGDGRTMRRPLCTTSRGDSGHLIIGVNDSQCCGVPARAVAWQPFQRQHADPTDPRVLQARKPNRPAAEAEGLAKYWREHTMPAYHRYTRPALAALKAAGAGISGGGCGTPQHGLSSTKSPNRLGLWYNPPPGHQKAVITSGCVPQAAEGGRRERVDRGDRGRVADGGGGPPGTAWPDTRPALALAAAALCSRESRRSRPNVVGRGCHALLWVQRGCGVMAAVGLAAAAMLRW